MRTRRRWRITGEFEAQERGRGYARYTFWLWCATTMTTQTGADKGRQRERP